MSMLKVVWGSAALVGMIAGSAQAQSSFVPVNNIAASRAALGVGTSLVPLDLSTASFLNGTINLGNNGFSTPFVGAGGNFSGSLGIEVFGNVNSLGASLNDVLLVYTMQANSGTFAGAESFDFGVDTSIELDFAALQAATHGRISADTSLEVGQLDPTATLFNNVTANDTFMFDFTNGGTVLGEPGQLGGGNAETYSWYIRSTGNVKLNFVDVLITDFGGTTVRSMSLVNNPGQPNLGVPAPGAAVGLIAGMGGLALRRRRR